MLAASRCAARPAPTCHNQCNASTCRARQQAPRAAHTGPSTRLSPASFTTPRFGRPQAVPDNSASSSDAKPEREIFCSDLYNLTQAIAESERAVNVPSTSSATPAAAAATSSSSTSAGSTAVEESGATPAATSTQQGEAAMASGANYYKGLVTSPLNEDNGADSASMLARSLQLAGGVAGVLAVLTYLFLASNGAV